MDKIQSLIINAINDKLPVGLANPILLIMTLIGQIISRINVYLSRITRKPTNLTQTKFQYLLEKPNNFKFDSSYLNSVTDSSSPLIKCLDDYCNAHQVYSKGAIVSLSGGVDSMVTLAILIHLQKTHNFPIYTASIDYGLRKESADESEFLIAYTKMFGIKSYVSYVEGISRKKEDSGSRSEFEEESRNLRFNTYKKIIEENGLDSDCGVFVGHHQDDIIENIFTNSMKGGNLLVAHEFNVPYFLDTTPKWSRRGKMRNEIFPLLDSVFGLDWHNKLKHLGDQSIEWGEYIGTYVVDPWMSEVVIGSRGIIIPIKPQPKLIYSHVILKALHKSGESMIRKTSMEKIMIMLNTVETNRVVTLDGTRMATLIKNNSYLMIFNKRFTKSESVDTQDIFNKFINGVVDITDSTQQKDLPIHLHKYIGSCW